MAYLGWGPMDDEDIDPTSSAFFADTRPNHTTVSRTRPSLDLEATAQAISDLEALPPSMARDRAIRLNWSIGTRLNDPWLKTRLLRLIYG